MVAMTTTGLAGIANLETNPDVAAGVYEARSGRMQAHGGALSMSPRTTDRRRAVFVLLASRSPRRRELLTEHGIDHLVVDSGIDDTHLESGQVDPAQWAMALAHLKAAGAARGDCVARGREALAGRKVVVLGADTIVVKNDSVLPAPTSRAVALDILRSLRGGQHRVISGVCLLDPASGERRLFADEARVRFGDVADNAIEHYLDSGAWQGKAGAYNIAERRAAGWPIEHEGDESTIVGLPMSRLRQVLDSLA
jgi:septum formation protein